MQTKTKKTNTGQAFGLRGVGPQMAKHLARLNIFSPKDLLLHLPVRYQNRAHIERIRKVIPGNEAVVQGVIQTVSKPSHGRTKVLCEIKDDSGKLFLRFFHALSYQLQILKPGVTLRCFGMVKLGSKGLEMTHPEMQVITDHATETEKYLTPIYPATEGISQFMLRKLMHHALQWMQERNDYGELLPSNVLQSLRFPTIKEAIFFIHKPLATTDIDALLQCKTIAHQRIAFEELLAHRISLLTIKANFQEQLSVKLNAQQSLMQLFLKQLPFTLTNAQQKVIAEIQEDLTQTRPMLRLVQGDVGSGKTVVAACALLQAIENHYQAALMAPTELLAEQHYQTLKKWLTPLNVRVVLLTSQIKNRARADVLNAIQTGDAEIIVGTHALFQKEVNYKQLALIVIDEQHRFGVEQRALLREKGMQTVFFPHQLVMTATPIPRTLAMSLYADLDCSIIDELPKGRVPIQTIVIANTRRDEIITRIRTVCKEGKQAYWVCPLIEESEALHCQSAIETAETLQTILSELNVDLIHGRMSSTAKEEAMRLFQQGKTHVLVATSVIEVGVDVANASLMIIENAERLGLSQLHQLRGRVGRGSVESFCVLMYQTPLSEIAKERLTVMRETADGFKIAERDLSLRGPGEFMGTRQTGALLFRVANLMRDSHLFSKVQETAEMMLQQYPSETSHLLKRWIDKNQTYGKV